MSLQTVHRTPTPQRRTVRRSLSDQLDQLIALREELSGSWRLPLDRERARARISAGQVAFDGQEMIEAAGSLEMPYLRLAASFERSGLLSSGEATQVRQRLSEVRDLLDAWLAGERLPRNGARRLAHSVAAVLGSSILKRAASDVRGTSAILSRWRRVDCPCCGGPADFSFTYGNSRRLVCARCDTVWRTTREGCLGCGANESPVLARIPSPDVGYALAICNACGRYVKERVVASRAMEPMVERMLTSHLDDAAEQRGLRL